MDRNHPVVRLESLHFEDLQAKIAARIRNVQNIQVQKSLFDQFLEEVWLLSVTWQHFLILTDAHFLLLLLLLLRLAVLFAPV